MSAFSRSPLTEKPAFQRALLRWYETHRRDLPWRKNATPYRVLISEFMLQQTRVETVIPYFVRFLKLFPTLRDLAQAPLPKILKAWAGLGYYTRARNLHAAAKTICQEFRGKIPRTKEDLLQLPGFGPYTAGAVASLAFNQRVAALDGNAERLLGRVSPGHFDFVRASAKKRSEKFLEGWIPRGRASDFNQALMDLGAMVCIPSKPRCSACPVSNLCPTKGQLPEKKPKRRKFREETWAVALVEKDGRFLLHRNEARGLLAGLWQFPKLVVEKDRGKDVGREDLGKWLERYLLQDFGLRVKMKSRLPEEKYFFTHIHTLMKPYLGSLAEPGSLLSTSRSIRWVKPSGFSRYPISTAMRKIAARLTTPTPSSILAKG